MKPKIRQEFPFLKRKYHGQPLAYLDNASTTQKPKVVIDAISDVYSNHYANIHRGVYDLSVEATEAYEGVREKVKKFINAKDPAEVIFTRNTTESINLLAYSLSSEQGLSLSSGAKLQGQSLWNLNRGDEILLSEMEHHSNIVPWQLLAERLKTNNKRRIKIKYLPIDDEGRLDLDQLSKFLSKKTKIVSLTLMSNVLGTVNPIKKIVKRIRELSTVNRELIIIVDAAQAVAHMPVDVNDLGCDFLVFSAHKMYGPGGVGVLWGKRELLEQMPPFMGGGDMILSVDFEKTTFNELPWKFEAGTPNIADVVAFGEALDFVQGIGFSRIQKQDTDLTDYALEQLSKDPLITIYGPKLQEDGPRQRKNLISDKDRPLLNTRGPVIAFNVDGVHPHDVASILSDQGVAIRSGHHCAQPLMKVMGVGAVCRVSFGVYNTKEEIDRLVAAIEKVKQVFRLSGTQVVRRAKRQFSRSPDNPIAR